MGRRRRRRRRRRFTTITTTTKEGRGDGGKRGKQTWQAAAYASS